MTNYIIPNPFNLSPYGMDDGMVFKQIINLAGASVNAEKFFPSNLITKNSIILEPKIDYLKSFKGVDMNNTNNHYTPVKIMIDDFVAHRDSIQTSFKDSNFVIIGGDHTIAIATGSLMSKLVNLEGVGMIWVDAHGDFNTPNTSSSKSLTGYPCAVNCGLTSMVEDEKLDIHFNNKFIKKCYQIGVRDIDELETQNLSSKGVMTYSSLDVETMGITTVIRDAIKHLSDCKYIWLSIDIDSLDPIYCDKGRTDVPVIGGLTPREILVIANEVKKTNKLKITEIVQINNTKNNFNLVSMANRVVEIVIDKGQYRYNN